MDTKTFNLFFSLLALAANVVTIAAIVAVIATAKNPDARARLRDSLGIAPRVLAFVVAATCMFGSLYYSLVRELEPCTWCWYQRIAMYPLVAILAVALLRRDRGAGWYVLPFVVVGPLMSTYHFLLERGVFEETGACSISCATPYFREFGFVTLAYMAGSGFLAIGALMLLDAVLHRDATLYPPAADDVVETAPDPEVVS